VASESTGYRAGAPAPARALRLRVPDAVLVALTLAPALAFLGG
jgi:hypothetical protein